VTSVVSPRAFANSANLARVVLMDMQPAYLAKPRLAAISAIDRALDNCRKVLYHLYPIGLPAFVRMIGESCFFNRATPFMRWIGGFAPDRHEMVVERVSPLCYSCELVAALVNQSRGTVLAELAGEAACLSTSFDGFHRNHKATFLCDMSASQAREEMSADEVHHAVSTISGVYAEVYEAAEGFAATAPRKLGNGKGAGG
jgi:hypothetical protein